LDWSGANRGRGRDRVSLHPGFKCHYRLSLILFSGFASGFHCNPDVSRFKINFRPNIPFKTHRNGIILLGLHLWQRRRRLERRLRTQSTKDIPFSSLSCLSQWLIAGDSLRSSSFRAEESCMTKNMAESTILGQSFIYNRLA
jgi:hypothetical protein